MGERLDEVKRRQENGQTCFFVLKTAFMTYIKEINTFTFRCMVIPPSSHLVYT